MVLLYVMNIASSSSLVRTRIRSFNNRWFSQQWHRNNFIGSGHTFCLGYGNYTIYAYIHDILDAKSALSFSISTIINTDSNADDILNNMDDFLGEKFDDIAT